MAKKAAAGDVNKSDEIRAYKHNNPEARPKDIVAALGERGITVSSALVSNVLNAANKKAGKRKAVRRKAKPGPKPRAASQTVDLNALVEAKVFASKVGGVEKAQSILKTLGRLF